MTDLPPEPNFALHPDAEQARVNADRLYERVASQLTGVLPPSVNIQHIGATAIAGCLTKGDLDIVVRVPTQDFGRADKVLAARFARNVGSKRTESFSSFEDDATVPHLGIQLTVVGSQDDCFHLFVNALRQDRELVAQYNVLKQKFDGQPMDVYRAAKSAFVTNVLARAQR